MIESVASPDNQFCVDVFEDPAGAFGFELLRADPEDGGRWTAVGRFASTRHDRLDDAIAAAIESVPWLSDLRL